MSKNKSNLDAPNNLKNRFPNNIKNKRVLWKWLNAELRDLKKHEKRIIKIVVKNLEEYVKWPQKANLMWKGCDRIVKKGSRSKYHKYPIKMRNILRKRGLKNIDTRANGPAVSSFWYSGGKRPKRYGSNNSWHIHHIYSGKFPYFDMTYTTHAVKSDLHFTQSAGLVAIHPIADQLCDEYPFFTWYLRALSYIKFNYDPDNVFSDKKHDLKGFVIG